MNNIQDFKKKFDEEIEQYLESKINYAKKIDAKGVLLFRIIKEFIKNGGKRLRPAIFYYSYLSYLNTNTDNIFRLSFAFELFHTFALIHDDIIDKSVLRRNKLTVHKKYGLETAILAGDLALVLADEIFFDQLNHLNLVQLQRLRTTNLFNRFKQELIIGEHLDYLKIDNVQKIMELKTARYSFVKPATLAFTLAEVNNKEILFWQETLNRTGVLFQIKDDYLGTFGDVKKIGKPIKSDFEEGKNTLIIKLFKERAAIWELKKFDEFFGRSNVKEKDFTWFVGLLEKKGIKKDIILSINREAECLLKKIDRVSTKNKYLEKIVREILISLREPS